MIELCAERGYLNFSVAEVASTAGVSSKTFYQLFSDKEDCLLDAYRQSAQSLLSDVQPVADDGDWSRAAQTALEELLAALQRNPTAGRLLLVEALAGGARVRHERERVLGLFEQRARQFLDSRSPEENTLDLPATALIGAVRGLVSRQLRTHNEDTLPLLVEDLLAWIQSYACASAHQRWSTGPRSSLPARAARTRAADRAIVPPEKLPRGRHRLPAAVIARSHRERIIHATAKAISERGYADATVTEIVTAAHISREVFYDHFSSKQDAYLAAQQYATQQILEACTTAYFSGTSWPERVWNALSALIELLVANPQLAQLRLVECYAAGPAAIEQTEALKRASTIFVQEGFSMPSAKDLPPIAAHAVVGYIFEEFYTHVSCGTLSQLPRLLPRMTYVATAPFIGPSKSIEAIEQLRGQSISAAGRKAPTPVPLPHQ
ncbi:MAG: TetR family transcriptional regulator [Solirubrobacteraceae bacterium]